MPKIVDGMIKDGTEEIGFYLKPTLGNPAFDFLISNYKQGELTIYFIDTTLQIEEKALNKKVDNFYKLVRDDICFQLLIEECNKS